MLLVLLWVVSTAGGRRARHMAVLGHLVCVLTRAEGHISHWRHWQDGDAFCVWLGGFPPQTFTFPEKWKEGDAAASVADDVMGLR